MSEIRGAGQQKHSEKRVDDETRFIAARLPLMGDALASMDDSMDGVILPPDYAFRPRPDDTNTATLPSLDPPTLTTTNTYVFPKNVYNIVCPPMSIWPEYAQYASGDAIWHTSQNFVFPKLAMPDQHVLDKRIKGPTTIIGSGIGGSANYPEPANESSVSRPSLPNSRDRSETKSSLDSKFQVATASRYSDTRSAEEDFFSDDKIGSWSSPMQGQTNGQRAFVDCTPGCTHLPLIEMAAREEIEVDRSAELQAMVDWICEDIEAQAQPLLDATESSSVAGSSIASSRSSISSLLPVSQLQPPMAESMAMDITSLPQHRMLLADDAICETESEGELVTSTAEQNGLAWAWEDDIWDSAFITPASEVEDVFGLWYDIWDAR